MIYTKENIIGLKFIHKMNNNKIIYTIVEKLYESHNVEITWNSSGKQKSTYSKDNVIMLLNDRTWIPINNEANYEIY